MWPMMVFRASLVILIGIALFWSLINVSCYYGNRKIRKRKTSKGKVERDDQTNFALLYLILLILFCILYFRANRAWIRGII